MNNNSNIKNDSDINKFAVETKDITLNNGNKLTVGVNFRTVNLLAQYKGGYSKFEKDINSNEDSKKINSISYLIYSLIRSVPNAPILTQEECEMLINPTDFDVIYDLFLNYSDSVSKLAKKKQ